MKTLTILSTLTVSALLATAANAGPQFPPVTPQPLQVASAAPQVLIQAPAAAAPVQQAIVAPAPAVAAASTAAPAPASPVVVHGQNVTITIDGVSQPQISYPAAPSQVVSPAAQPGAAPATVAPQTMQTLQALMQVMMSATPSTTYQPFPPDTQRKVNCLVATGGNYVTCGVSEAVGHALGHVYAELAKCMNGVNVAGGCFAPPKRVAQANRTRR
jgi:hypothetical protein